jgi:hypothetical protein
LLFFSWCYFCTIALLVLSFFSHSCSFHIIVPLALLFSHCHFFLRFRYVLAQPLLFFSHCHWCSFCVVVTLFV